jgi:dTDP-4-amino-4,6-dideoxygalactose transaminase
VTADNYLPYCRPTVDDEEIAAVEEVLRSGWITTGPRTRAFEEAFAEAAGSGHALAVNSGTAALHVALAAAGVGSGDEVITTPITFCACANVIVQLGARPVLADVCEDDLNIDPVEVERRITERTKAVMAVDFAGQPCRLDDLTEVTARKGIFLLEDAAHSAGALYRDRPIGSIADATAFSFYATKNMTTGEGGMLTTSSDEIDSLARTLALHGMSRDAWKRYQKDAAWAYDVVAAGFKYNMSDIQAALGMVQLRRLDEFNAMRSRLARRYNERLASCDCLRVPATRADVRRSWHLYVIRLRLDRLRIDRSAFIDELTKRGIGTSVHFIPIHHHSFYREGFGFAAADYPVAERVFPEMISLPLYPLMTEDDVDRVADAVIGIAESNEL